MATKLTHDVTRETCHGIGARPLIATLTPSGIRIHLKGTQQSVKIDYLGLFLQLQAEARRGGQSEIGIAPRKGRRS